MQESPPDLSRLAEALEKPGLKAVLIGGMAVVYHGGSNITTDVDFAIAYDRENVDRLVLALAPLHPRPPGGPLPGGWVWDKLCIRPPWSVFMTDAGHVDLIVRLPGIDSFQGLYDRSVHAEIGGFSVRVASIEDLIAMKSVSERERDILHVKSLEAILRVRLETDEVSGA